MVSTSFAVMTASFSTLQKRAILSLSAAGRNSSVLQSRMSGWMPISRSSLTLCCVGFVFISPAVLMKGTRVRWMKRVFSLPRSFLSWRIASRKGRLSMSPTVPPISTITMSIVSSTSRIIDFISSVIWGITWTVPPRYSPLRSFDMTES